VKAAQLTVGLRWLAGEEGTAFVGQKEAAEVWGKYLRFGNAFRKGHQLLAVAILERALEPE